MGRRRSRELDIPRGRKEKGERRKELGAPHLGRSRGERSWKLDILGGREEKGVGNLANQKI